MGSGSQLAGMILIGGELKWDFIKAAVSRDVHLRVSAKRADSIYLYNGKYKF